MASTTSFAPAAWLVPLPSGTPVNALELKAAPDKHGGLTLGRNKDCDLPLPADAESVSRRHAEFLCQSGQWHIADRNSRWGTFVNGVRLKPDQFVRLSEGDLVRIQPWTFRFSRDRTSNKGSVSIDDHGATMVRTLVGERSAEPLRQDMLNLLLEGASAIQAAADEAELVSVIVKLARRGTGLQNATVLRALDAEGRVDTVMGSSAADGGRPTQSSEMRFSRSLLAAASQGVVAEFSSSDPSNISQSIIQANVTTALCAPLMLGTTVAAYLYLDSRADGSSGGGVGGGWARPANPNASGFCQALCRIGGLALANLKRIDIERRAAHMEAELTAAAAAQRWILPREPISAGPFTCVGRSQPGGYLGGDFFDVLVLPDGRLAVTLGDVSGHGAAASVLMTAAQGFIHASLIAHGELARAVTALNVFLEPRCSGDKFITLWTGIFDPQQMSLEYVDAGHGYALLVKAADKRVQSLDEHAGVPVGAASDFQYETATAQLAPGDRALLFTDGIVEQVSEEAMRAGERQQFGIDGVARIIEENSGEDLLTRLFQALHAFAGGKGFTDDVTGVLVQCSSQS
jgi:serine phosphatase RsbU (regulator of sigma subunit)